ncbi:hypothetical protein Lal_00018407 [Lupinus albus]|uniref:Uncharacterized protein n=1 Tax=Lupinus albus TaxID=3870 RepID=A0A6A5M3P7_LUPAL|nr:hypothetical protein Lalb_Chr04g0255761 [Lupinus albus]KAF1869314.1 hypothetical protein Lal_00018407 [Lupinus albus]
MKISFTSITLIIFIVFLLFFFSSTNSVPPSHALSLINPSITSHNHNHNHNHLGYCDSFSRKNPRSLCIELQNMHQRMHTPLPPSKENGIDPRYDEEKRVVPSGPDHHHNGL